MAEDMQENKPVLIVGLGNPGAEYSRTRHNVGFMAADILAGQDAVWKKEKNALVAKAEILPDRAPPFRAAGTRLRVILAKPQTFMNLSGAAVQSLMTFYKIPLENLIVIHDDIDIKLGEAREKVGGGSAGHNGIKSIDAAVGRDYRRIRIGVGRPGGQEPAAGDQDVSDWVLGKFSDEELAKINEVLAMLRCAPQC
jgi:PTH1 family peptidyl-tRNA hydrolase